jgi:hypothetical protein
MTAKGHMVRTGAAPGPRSHLDAGHRPHEYIVDCWEDPGTHVWHADIPWKPELKPEARTVPELCARVREMLRREGSTVDDRLIRFHRC